MKKRHTGTQIVAKLRQADILIGQGKTVPDVCKEIEVSPHTYYRWLLSTHQGAVSPKHLGYYLDEYAFRFNRRTSRSRGMLFYRLMQQAVLTPPIRRRAPGL